MSSKSPDLPPAIASLFNPELLLSVATVPVLAGMLAGQAISKGLQELGTMSEEIFRGDRLPVLEFPTSEQSEH
jgi:hypothetical protein